MKSIPASKVIQMFRGNYIGRGLPKLDSKAPKFTDSIHRS
jgi:hypothetical protein